MKTFKMMAMALMAVAMCANFASCSNEDNLSEEQGKEYVTVKLGCGGEILDIKNSPLSRAGEATVLDSDDLLLVLIREVVDTDGDGNYEESSIYANAVINYQENIELKLLKGKHYRVYANVIVDGDKNGYQLSYDRTDGVVYNNLYSLSDDLFGTNYGQYNFDRFYGVLDNFVAVDGENIEVPLYRVAYAISLKASGLGTDETLDIKVSNYNDYYNTNDGDYPATLASDNETNYNVMTVREIQWAWDNAVNGYDYTETKYLTITWNKPSDTSETGTEAVNMGTYEVTFKRNAKTTVTIVPQDLNASGTLTVTAEAWGEDINFQIQDGQVTEQGTTEE